MRTISPLSKLVVTAVIGVALLLSLDPISATVALVIELCLLPWAGLPPRRLVSVVTPVLIAAPFAGIATLLFGRGDGEVIWAWGPWSITQGNLLLALAITVRVMAIALPAVVLFATTDPTDLADALAQIWKLPARFVIAALAAIRMLGLVGEDWRMLTLARRARGISDGRTPWQALRSLGTRSLALFTIVIRRGSLLATAMEARAFDSARTRSWARHASFTARDGWFIVGGVAVAALAVGVAVLGGAWNFVVA